MRKFLLGVVMIAMCWFAAYAAHAAELEPPAHAVADAGFDIKTSGSGSDTLILIGPATALKREVTLGQPVSIAGDEARAAGRYIATLASSDSGGKEFFVSPGKAADLVFLARPSRVATAQKDAISGVAFVFDEYKNLVLAPTPVKFALSVEGHAPVVRTVSAREGVAWTHMDSTSNQGAAQFVASLPEGGSDASIRRVVQQVAAEACNLRMKAQPQGNAILVETEPIKDCSGNPVPDGTIVTFTETDASGISTVDARIKKDVARAELPASRSATINVASGVVLGNEIHWGGGE
jgi:hypothetical protein